jgi:hypothetical protein
VPDATLCELEILSDLTLAGRGPHADEDLDVDGLEDEGQVVADVVLGDLWDAEEELDALQPPVETVRDGRLRDLEDDRDVRLPLLLDEVEVDDVSFALGDTIEEGLDAVLEVLILVEEFSTLGFLGFEDLILTRFANSDGSTGITYPEPIATSDIQSPVTLPQTVRRGLGLLAHQHLGVALWRRSDLDLGTPPPRGGRYEVT